MTLAGRPVPAGTMVDIEDLALQVAPLSDAATTFWLFVRWRDGQRLTALEIKHGDRNTGGALTALHECALS